MVVEGFITMIDDISSVAHQALAGGGGGGVVAVNNYPNPNIYGPSGDSINTSATGNNNVALGLHALQNLTTGVQNIAIGRATLKDVSGGGGNVAVGHTALTKTANSSGNTAVGCCACADQSGGLHNTALGYGAAQRNVGGRDNVTLGFEAGTQLLDSSYNVAVGSRALAGAAGSWAKNNVAVGYEAMSDASGAYNNVAIGYKTLTNISGGNGIVAIGYEAMQNSNGDNCELAVAIGTRAMQNAGPGCWSTAVGHSALKNMTTGVFNTGLGYGAGSSVRTGDNNTSVGGSSGPAGHAAGQNTIMGMQAGMETQGNDNTAVGYYALRSVDGSYNVAIGSQAMYAYAAASAETATRAWYNVAVGFQALREISGGEQNVAVGFQALADGCVDGSHNVVIGSKAGRTLGFCADWGHASRNTFVGGHAGEYGSGGLRNGVALGYEAGQYMIAAGNVAIGYKSMRMGGPLIGWSSPSVTIGNYAGEMMSDGSGGNVAVGSSALQRCISGCYNVAVGSGALSSLSGEVNYPWNSSNNVAIGTGALQTATKAMNNTIIGTMAGNTDLGSDVSGLLVLNATGRDFPNAAEITAAGGAPAAKQDRFYVKPVREAAQSNALYYNPTSGEVTHSGAGSAFSSGGYGSKWITATDASNNGWNAHPYGGSGLGTSPVSLGTLTGLHESDILAAFASGTHAMRARITIYGAGGGGGGGTSGSTGNGRNGQGGGSGAMYTFINYDVSATLWDNSAGLLGLAGGGSPGAAPGQFEGAYGTGGGAGGGPPPVLITGGNTPAAGSASNPIGYVPTFYDALWSSYYTPTYPHGFGIGGGGGGMGGVSTGTTAGGGTGGVIQGPGSVTALTPHLGNWRVPSVTFPALPGNVNSPGAVGAGTTSYGPSYVAQPGAAAGLLLTNSPFLSKNAWGTDGGVEGKGNQGPYGAGGALAWSFPALPGGDAKYSAGGGGGGASFQWSTEAGKRGGKGGDALMIIEWWL